MGEKDGSSRLTREKYANSYNKLTPTRLRRYWWLWWGGIAATCSILTLAVTHWFNEPFPVLGVAAFWGLFFFLPTLSFVMEKMYSGLCEELEIIYSDSKEFAKWFDRISRDRLFVFNCSPWFLLTFAVVFLGILGTVLAVGIPFKHPFLQIASFLALTLPAIFAGQAAYLILVSLYILWRMADFSIKPIYFYSVNVSPFSRLYSIYYTFSSLIIVGYGLTSLLMWRSPMDFDPTFLWFLVAISTFPLALLILSALLITRIQRRVRRKLMEHIDTLIRTALRKLEADPSKENSECVTTLLELQSEVSKIKLLPLNIEGFFVFITSAAIPAAQFMLSFL